MARHEHPQKKAVLEAVREHLQRYGSTNWNLVTDQFPHVPQASMWRWIKQVKDGPIPASELITAKAKITQRVKHSLNDRVIEARENGTEQLVKHVPSAPSPSYVARHGEQALQQLDFATEIHSLYSDAMMLREYSVKRGEDGKESIKNPVLFERQISRRTALIDTGIRTLQELWDLRTMQAFYETIITEIGKESPEAQKRILEKLQALNSQKGYTMFMKV